MTDLLAGIVQCAVCGRIAADDNLSACDAEGCISRGIGWHYIERELTCSVCLKIISHPATGSTDLALAYYGVAMTGTWDGRFGEFRDIVACDYLRLLRPHYGRPAEDERASLRRRPAQLADGAVRGQGDQVV